MSPLAHSFRGRVARALRRVPRQVPARMNDHSNDVSIHGYTEPARNIFDAIDMASVYDLEARIQEALRAIHDPQPEDIADAAHEHTPIVICSECGQFMREVD